MTQHHPPGGVVLRLLVSIVLVTAVAFGAAHVLGWSQQYLAQRQLESDVLQRLLGQAELRPTKRVPLSDSNGDLLTDPPAESECVTPETLVFAYIATPKPGDEPAAWVDLLTALGEAVGRPVEYRHFNSTQEQLDALAAGDLHIAGLSTGTVPIAVGHAGFNPMVTLGREDGGFGYKMQVLAPSAAPFDDLAGFAALGRDERRVAYTSPTSNSGFKAAMVELMNGHGLLPERDYEGVFSSSHESSVKMLIDGEANLAPVASDLLERMVAMGEVDASAFKTVYESERFPPAAIGVAHNLAPSLREAIRDALLAFAWDGTSVEAQYGPAGAARFVPVTYKDDWANTRRIDDAIRAAR